MTTITIPDFNYASFYYAQILEALIVYKRINLPELTEESDVEPSIQLMRMMALVGHLNNTLMDTLANENTLPTAKIAENVRNMLRLIDYEMSPATPAQVDVVYELSLILTTAVEIITERAQVATKKTTTLEPVYFEALEGLTVDRTDQHSHVLAEEAGAFTDFTTLANSAVTPGDDWQPWVTPEAKDAIYWGHKHAMWTKLSVTLTSGLSGINGVYEFYDGNFRKISPTSVTNLGATLELNVNSLLGTADRRTTLVRIQLNTTTAYEDVYSTWNGSYNIATTTGLLGQSSPSTDVDDYTIGSDWTELDVTDTGPEFQSPSQEISYDLPQTLSQDWALATIDGKTAYWFRYRIISVAAPTVMVFQQTRMDGGKQYLLRSTTQGRTIIENPLGSSIGLEGQTFLTAKEHFLWNSETLTVDGDIWVRVDNFLASESGSKHYVIKLGENDKATVVFGGDGKGLIPPVGAGNIAITYRYGAETNGNVGYEAISIDKTGLSFINKIWNPRGATGWKEAEGATEESLEIVKIEGPASIRVKDVAISPDDVVYLAENFIDSAGASSFSRAKAIEEGFGPKTIELVVVAAGGGLASSAQLAALDLYFNGDQFANPPVEKHLVANQEVTSTNYAQKAIDVTATVYGNVTQAVVENRLSQILQPEAKDEDGINYLWDFGETIHPSRLNSEIFGIDSSITKVVITTPFGDVGLQGRELPIAGTLNITVITP